MMTDLATKRRKYWTCRRCSHWNEATRSRKCQSCGEMSRPKKRVPVHARTLRDDSYFTYVAINGRVHRSVLWRDGFLEPDSCGVCGKPKPENRRHDRDHDHRAGSPSYGKPRGLACTRCNKELLRNATLEEARAVVAYLERVEAYWREQDEQVSRLDNVSADCAAY